MEIGIFAKLNTTEKMLMPFPYRGEPVRTIIETLKEGEGLAFDDGLEYKGFEPNKAGDERYSKSIIKLT